MKKRLLSKKALSTAIVIPLLLSGVSGVSAGEFQKNNVTSNLPGIQLEYLERGLVAAPTSQGIFLSWRLLANEVKGYSETGLTGVNFNVYRDGKQIATVEDSTNFVDKEEIPIRAIMFAPS